MSDLTDLDPDQRATPNARIEAANRRRRDRDRRLPDLIFAFGLLLLACVKAPATTGEPEVHRPAVWVDAFSAAGGDGSSERPLKTLPAVLRAGETVKVRSGLYPGPFVLEPGARLEGVGEVVLTGEGDETVVTAQQAALAGVAIQGGGVGLEAGTGVVVERTRFSGQRKQAVVVHGGLTLSAAKLVASVEGIDGVVVEPGAQLAVSQSSFEGGFRRAVTADGATVTLEDVRGDGVRTLLRAVDSVTRVHGVRTARGSGPGLFAAGGTFDADDVQVEGHEFSLQLGAQVVASVKNLKARAPLQGCVSVVMASLTLRDSRLVKCGDIGLTLMESKTSLVDVQVEEARELGVLLRGGSADVQRLSIKRISRSGESLGDALHARGTALTGGQVLTEDLAGSGLFASAYATVQLGQLEVARAARSALFVERGAAVTLGGLLVRGGSGPTVVVPDAAKVEIEAMSVAGGTESPVWAECRDGAEVKIGRLESSVPQLSSACVQVAR